MITSLFLEYVFGAMFINIVLHAAVIVTLSRPMVFMIIIFCAIIVPIIINVNHGW